MFGLFGSSKDWNIVAIMFEREDHYRVNGNRVKGKNAEEVKLKTRLFERTLYWAVFDQKGAFIDGGKGGGHHKVDPAIIKKIEANFRLNPFVLNVLKELEGGKNDKVSTNFTMD